jgi:hypothetical protein
MWTDKVLRFQNSWQSKDSPKYKNSEITPIVRKRISRIVMGF